MKIAMMFQIVLIFLFLAVSAQAQTAKRDPDCDKPLSERSKADVICNADDKNLAKARAAAGKTEGGSPDQEKPGYCDKCEEEKNRFAGRLSDKTAAPASPNTGGKPATRDDGQQ